MLTAVLSLAACLRSKGQVREMEVTSIPEVIVTEKNSKFFSEDQTTITLRESHPQASRQLSLGAVLDQESHALIRSYGSAGSLVSLSLHGTGTNHTAVSWNGFPLNSPTTGQADLSLIPFGFMQSVQMVSGASGALFGSGTFGGIVEMVNKPDWSNRLSVHITSERASFHSRSDFLSFQAGNKRLQYALSVIDSRARNDFDYRDKYRYNNPEVRAVHNDFAGGGVIQNLHLNAGNGNFVEAGAWFQYKRKDIPALMGSYIESHARQVDKTFRSYLDYSKQFHRSVLLLKSAWFTDDLWYTDKNAATDTSYAVDSRIVTGKIMGSAEYRQSLFSYFVAGAGISVVHLTASTNNYYHDISENDFALYGSLKFMLADLVLNTGIRQEFYEGTDPSTQFSIGLRYRMGEQIILRSNISSKFRKPTLNERYWKPGGNPALRPEKGWGGEISAEVFLVGQEDRDLNLSFNGTLYYQSIDNWIQWIAGDSLTPVEYKKVHARGTEAVLQYRLPAGHVQFYGNVNYTFNNTLIKDTYDGDENLTGLQLVYIPRHAARINLNVQYKGWMAGCYGAVSGARETIETADPYTRLPAYGLIDLVAGFTQQTGKIRAELLFRIENLLGKQYEVVRSYPMPGRAYHITVSMDFRQ